MPSATNAMDMDIKVLDPDSDTFTEPEPTKPSLKNALLNKLRLRKNSIKEDAIPREPPPQSVGETLKKTGSREVGIGPPRQLTFRRRLSEQRERLEPVEPSDSERRAFSATRKRALSEKGQPIQRNRTRSSPPPSCPRFSLSALDQSNRTGGNPLSLKNEQQNQPPEPLPSYSSEGIENLEDAGPDYANIEEDPQGIPEEDLIQQDLDQKWILNLSMHFRDKSDREKFFLTYAETPTKWRRVTVSCDYRHAEPGSLEMDLKELQFQRDKNFQIYESIRESLPEIQFYDTVTNLKLETSKGRLHVHVTEDVNEIIPYPPVQSVEHLLDPYSLPPDVQPLRTFTESEVVFQSHLSGFVYKVSVDGEVYIKKEIPGPDSVDEFLYEINALHALIGSSNVIQLQAIILDDTRRTVKGLLISYAEHGALVDLLFDNRETGIPWRDRLKWASQVVCGLNEVHEAGFVQGDFTLSNIVIDGNGDAAIIDINRRGCPVGWEPPEIERRIRSNQRISMYIGVKTDLFQLGMTLWALANEDDEPERRDRRLLLEEFPADIPIWYRRIVKICLSPRPQDRLSAKDLLDLFRVELQNQPEEPSDAYDEKDLNNMARVPPFTLSATPQTSGADINSFDENVLVRSPVSSYRFGSQSSYVGVSYIDGPRHLDSEAEEYRRGRTRLREDEMEVDTDSVSEPRILSISPGFDRKFEEVELEGNTYLVQRSTFSQGELAMMHPHPQENPTSNDQAVDLVGPSDSVETVAARQQDAEKSTFPNPLDSIETIPAAQQATQPSSQEGEQPAIQLVNQLSTQELAQSSTQPVTQETVQPSPQSVAQETVQPSQPVAQEIVQPSTQPVTQETAQLLTQQTTQPSAEPASPAVSAEKLFSLPPLDIPNSVTTSPKISPVDKSEADLVGCGGHPDLDQYSPHEPAFASPKPLPITTEIDPQPLAQETGLEGEKQPLLEPSN